MWSSLHTLGVNMIFNPWFLILNILYALWFTYYFLQFSFAMTYSPRNAGIWHKLGLNTFNWYLFSIKSVGVCTFWIKVYLYLFILMKKLCCFDNLFGPDIYGCSFWIYYLSQGDNLYYQRGGNWIPDQPIYPLSHFVNQFVVY